MSSRLTEDDHARARAAEERLVGYYRETDSLLTNADYLAGDYTYADIAFFMAQLFAAALGVPASSDCARFKQWRERVAARPAVKLVAERVSDYFRENARR